MSKFQIHTLESAPQESKALVEQSQKQNGFLPNLHGVMAEAPGLLEGYQVLHKLFSESSFNAEELTVVWQTINIEHECHYCVPAHTAIAGMMKVDPQITQSLRSGEKLEDEKLEVLRQTTLSMVRNRGKVSDAEIETFFAAGYNQRHLLEIVLGLSQKVMSNYTNHLAKTPLDEAFSKFA